MACAENWTFQLFPLILPIWKGLCHLKKIGILTLLTQQSKPGEKIKFEGYDSTPLPSITLQQYKQLEPHMVTDYNGIATYKNIAFTTSGGGECKVSTLTNAKIL